MTASTVKKIKAVSGGREQWVGTNLGVRYSRKSFSKETFEPRHKRKNILEKGYNKRQNLES